MSEELLEKINVTKIIVRTGIAEKAGLCHIEGIDYSELDHYLKDNLRRIKSEYIALIPDINVPFSDFIIYDVKNFLKSEVDAIIVISRSKGIFGKLLSKLGALEIIDKITGHPHGYLIIFKKKLLGEGSFRGSSIISMILAHSRRVYQIVYEIPLSEHILAVYGRLPYSITLLLKEPGKVIRFGIVGGLGALVNIATVVIMANLLGYVHGETRLLLIPIIFGFEASIVFNFILHELWTFREMNLPKGFINRLRRLFKYHLSSIASFVIQSSAILILSGIFKADLALSAFIGIFLGFIANYIIGRTITWHYK